MKQSKFPAIEDHFQKVAMNLRPKTRLFRNLFACCLFVIDLLGSPVQTAHSASIVADGDIVGECRIVAGCDEFVYNLSTEDRKSSTLYL